MATQIAEINEDVSDKNASVQKSASPNGITLKEELVAILEPLIRRIVREELEEFAIREPDTWFENPDSPLYESMIEIQKDREAGKIKLYTREEVWGE